MVVITQKGLNSLLSSSFKVGGDASVAAGPVRQVDGHRRFDLVLASRPRRAYGYCFLMNRLSPADILVLNFVGLPPLINAPSNW